MKFLNFLVLHFIGWFLFTIPNFTSFFSLTPSPKLIMILKHCLGHYISQSRNLCESVHIPVLDWYFSLLQRFSIRRFLEREIKIFLWGHGSLAAYNLIQIGIIKCLFFFFFLNSLNFFKWIIFRTHHLFLTFSSWVPDLFQ